MAKEVAKTGLTQAEKDAIEKQVAADHAYVAAQLRKINDNIQKTLKEN